MSSSDAFTPIGHCPCPTMFRCAFLLAPLVGLIGGVVLHAGPRGSVASRTGLVTPDLDSWSDDVKTNFVPDGRPFEKEFYGGGESEKKFRKKGGKDKRQSLDDGKCVFYGILKYPSVNNSETTSGSDRGLGELMKHFVHERRDKEKKIERHREKADEIGEHWKDVFENMGHSFYRKSAGTSRKELSAEKEDSLGSDENDEDDDDTSDDEDEEDDSDDDDEDDDLDSGEDEDFRSMLAKHLKFYKKYHSRVGEIPEASPNKAGIPLLFKDVENRNNGDMKYITCSKPQIGDLPHNTTLDPATGTGQGTSTGSIPSSTVSPTIFTDAPPGITRPDPDENFMRRLMVYRGQTVSEPITDNPVTLTPVYNTIHTDCSTLPPEETTATELTTTTSTDPSSTTVELTTSTGTDPCITFPPVYNTVQATVETTTTTELTTTTCTDPPTTFTPVYNTVPTSCTTLAPEESTTTELTTTTSTESSTGAPSTTEEQTTTTEAATPPSTTPWCPPTTWAPRYPITRYPAPLPPLPSKKISCSSCFRMLNGLVSKAYHHHQHRNRDPVNDPSHPDLYNYQQEPLEHPEDDDSGEHQPRYGISSNPIEDDEERVLPPQFDGRRKFSRTILRSNHQQAEESRHRRRSRKALRRTPRGSTNNREKQSRSDSMSYKKRMSHKSRLRNTV